MVTEMPITILAFIFAFCTALIALGYIYRTSFPMSFMWFITGAIFLLIFIVTDTITLDDRTLKINGTSTDTIDINLYYDNNAYAIKVTDEAGDYTAQPTFVGIMLILLSLSFIMIGILIERT